MRMNITIKDAVDGFRKQWNWMADETLRQKRKVGKIEYFNAHSIGFRDMPFRCCYLCEFVVFGDRDIPVGFNHFCNDCPVEWGGKVNQCVRRNWYINKKGIYQKWFITANYKKAARLAREIANMPLKIKYMNDYENEQN